MAPLRFPGRPGYRFDRIGIRYSAHEARQTTDPTLAIVARIHKGLQWFRNIFGDSDEEDTEFLGFTPAEVRVAERNLQQIIKEEKLLHEQQVQKQKYRFERSKATLASLAAAKLELPKKTQGVPENLRKTYKKIVDTGLVKDAAHKIRSKPQLSVTEATAVGKQNGQPVAQKVSNSKHIALKRLSHNVDTQPVFRRPVGRPRKYNTVLDMAGDAQKASSFESIMAASSVFGAKPISKYTMARQILARATKQAVHTSNKLLTSTHKVRKFVLPTKSSRSSRVIKPNKRFLEDDSVHQLVAKHPKISPTSPTSITSFKTPIFGMGVSVDKSNSFSAFQSCGLSLSPFNMNREKGFPVFSAAPQPCGTSSFMDGLASQKPLGSLDQPLIVEGKRPRKPSLIMRMKLVEDDPADEIRLQQQLSDSTNSVKPTDGQKPPTDSKFSSPQLPTLTKCFGATKSLIAPAKLFTDSSTCSLSSKSFKHQQSLRNIPSQSTVVLRQAKFQLNRTALNRSKAALARSLKAQLKREAKLERRKRTSQNRLERLSGSTPSSGSSLSQLSPFSKLASDSAIERQKSGLFEGIEAGAGSFSPGSFGSPPVTPSSLSAAKSENKKAEVYHASMIKDESLLINYLPGSKWRCLVCSSLCIIKKNRKLPQVPLCKSCKKSYLFQLNPKSGQLSKRKCKCEGKCSIHYSQKSSLHCMHCKFAKFEAIMRKCRELGIESKMREEKKASAEEPFSPTKKQRHKSEEMTTPESRQNKQKREESDGATPTRHRHKHKSGDKLTELSGLRQSAKSPSHSKELINASNLDKPLSVDVGQDTDPFSLSPPQTLSSTKSSPDKNSRPPSKKLSLTSNGSDRMSENDEDNDAGRSRGSSRGPRIKHVCRRAAMVFPQQRATFPEEPQKRTLTLSALPNEEKQQLWAKSKQEKTEDSSTEDSSDDTPQSKMTAITSPDKKLLSPKDDKQTDIRKDKKMGSHLDKKTTLLKDEKIDDVKEGRTSRNKAMEVKTVPAIATKIKKRLSSEREKALALAAKRRGYTRKIRCKECKGCKTPDCGVCVFCRDKPKFGGPGRIKKCCIHSVCLTPKIPRKATQAFIDPKSPTKTYRRDDDDQNGDHHTRSQNSATGFRESSSRYQEKRASNHWKMDGSGDGAKDDGEVEGATEDMDTFHQNGLIISGPSSSSIPNGLDMDESRFRSKTITGLSNSRVVRYAKGKYTPAVEATIQLALTDVRNPFIGRMTDAFVGRMKHRDKISVPQKQYQVELKPVQNETAYSFDVPLKTHLIRADFEDGYDVELAWSHGFSLTLTGPSCVRALCYLCGSAGKHEMLYCLVCCQPYHSFCLEEDERPEDGDNEEEDDGVDDSNHHHHGGTNSNTISWCCRRCQFCHVCGHQNGLLKCHRCKDTYHPECLGPNYPTRPSHKNIWVCTKCVRCKSCGATTPGVGTNATWTYDFSLCYECGKLMDKGNFCPICHKCYSDDDWESKMVQCAVCESWVHAKCEELTDEMYQLVSFLPEEVQYTCRVCSTDSPPYWERVLKSELVNGLLNVLNGLLGSKCAQMLLDSGPPRDYKKLKQIKERISDGLRVDVDDNSNSETTSNKALNSSTDSIESPQDIRNFLFTSVAELENGQEEQTGFIVSKLDEQAISKSTDSIISNYTKHLLTRRVEEIVEKCDCEAVQTSIDNQTTSSYSHTSGKNLLFTDKLSDTDSIDSCNSIDRTYDVNNILHTSNACLPGINGVGLKSVTRKELTTCESEAVTNGGSGLYNNIDDKDVTDILLGLVGKEGDIGNPTILSTINGDVNSPKDFKKTAYSNCDKSKCVNSICSNLATAVSIPNCRTFAASSSHNLPSISSHCMQDSLNIQLTDALSDSSGQRTSLPNKLSTFSSGSFYPNSNRESVTKNLFSNHHSLPDFVKKSGMDDILQSGSNCAFAACIDDCNNVSENNNKDISPPSNSKCVEYIQPSECSVKSALIQPNDTAIDRLQQPVVPSLALTTVGFPLDMVAHHLFKEHQGKTQENMEIARQNSATCLHVSFGVTVQEALNHNGEFPRDFNSIRLKIDSGSYSTVEEFSEDMVRIIQSLLFENEQYTTRKKQANSVRSIFIKQMERFFPWFNVNTCKLWEHNRGLPTGMLRDAVLPPSSDHTYAQWLERKNSPMSPQPSPFKRVNSPQRRCILDDDNLEVSATEKIHHHFVQNEDTRACLLCQQFGDDEADCAGRLLYCGQDDWIHINCALWSAEVFEQDNGSLQNVPEAISRGKKLRCNLCQLTGATVGCCEANCRANYHFMCARADKCVFQEDKTIFCRQHSDCVIKNVVKDGHFDISSRVCVNLDKIRAKFSWGKAVDPATLNVIIGSCTVESLGVLQSSLSDTEECLYPVDFRCTRIYWSTQDARRRCVYTCRIVKVEPDMDSPGVRIHDLRVIHDENHPDFVPLDQLNLESLGIPNFIKPNSKVCSLAGETCDEMDDVVFLGSDLITMNMTSVSFSSQSVSVCTNTQISSNATQTIGKGSLQSGSFQVIQNQILQSENPEHCFIIDEDDPHGVSKSWQLKPPKQIPKVAEPKPIDLSGLSPSTLALLSIKDPSRYIIPPPRPEIGRSSGEIPAGIKSLPVIEEELGLVKIADRLNNAASGRARQPKVDPDRSILRSPPFLACSSKQQYNQFWIQKQQSKSQSPSPVSFKPAIRPRSNSEGKHENSLSPLPSPGGITTVLPATLSHPQLTRARSESPFSVMTHRELTTDGFRSSSLSPPPVTVKRNYTYKTVSFPSPSSFSPTQPHYLNPQGCLEYSRSESDAYKDRTSNSISMTPVVEVLESEDEEKTTTEDANKKSNLDPNLHFDSFEENKNTQQPEPSSPDSDKFEEKFGDAGSCNGNTNASGELILDIISTENLKSILESVPPEVLEGDDVKVVVLSDIDDLTEEDIIKLASSVVQESTGDQVVGSENVETGRVGDGEMNDNDDHQGEESTHEGKAEGADSDQGNSSSGASIDGNHDDGGSDATNSGHDVKESDNVPSTSSSNIPNTGHSPYCHSNSADHGLVPTSSSSSSGDTQEGNGDDDDLRKPHKSEDYKTNKDVIFHDLDENVIEKDNESMDTSSEGPSESVRNSAAEGQDQDKTGSSEVCSRNVISDVDKIDEVKGCNEISNKTDSSSLASNNRINSCSFITQDDDDKCLPLSSVTEKLINSSSENADAVIRTSCKFVESDKPHCAHLPSSEKNNTPKEDVVVDSTIHAMDESHNEADDSGDQSFTELSEDDVKIIDLSDSEKAEKLDSLEIVSVRSGSGITAAADVKNIKIIKGNCADKDDVDQICIKAGGNICIRKECADQQSKTCSSPSPLRAQMSGLTHNVKGTSKSGQIKTKAGANIFVGAHDTTTDEESDYLMLDDFSYSETNDEDECFDGGSSTEKGKELSRPALPEVSLKNIQEVSSQELNPQQIKNAAVNNQIPVALQEHNTQQNISSSILVRKKQQGKIEESQKLPQTPLMLASKNEDCEEIKSTETETISQSTQLSKCPDNENSGNSFRDEHQCSSVSVVDNITQSFICQSQVKLNECYVSLCKEDMSNQHLSSVNCTSPSKSRSSERKHMQLRARKLSVTGQKPYIACKFSSNFSSMADGSQDCPQVEQNIINTDKNEQNVINADKKTGMKKLVRKELYVACDDNNKTDISEQTDEITLVELKNEKLQDEERRNEQENPKHQPDMSDLKASKNPDKEIELNKQNKVSSYADAEPGFNISADNKEGEKDVQGNESGLSSMDACIIQDIDESIPDNEGTIEKQACQMYQNDSNDHPESSKFEIEKSYGECKSSEIEDYSKYEDFDVVVNNTDLLNQNISSRISTLDNDSKEKERKFAPFMTPQIEDLKVIVPREEHTNTHDNIDTKEVSLKNEEHSQQSYKQTDAEKQVSCPAFLNRAQHEDCVDDPELLELSKADLVEIKKLVLNKEKIILQDLSVVKTNTETIKIFKDLNYVEVDEKVEGIAELSRGLYSNNKYDQKSQGSGSLITSKSCDEVIEPDSGEDEKELLQIDNKMSTPPDLTRPTTGGGKSIFYSAVLSEQRDRVGSSSDDNLHERIVEKIKAESLARSSPGEEGPFKCPTCKRMYRTRESYEFHVRDCDFEVSTSDEEDKPVVKELRSQKRYGAPNEDRKQRVISDSEKLNSLSSSSPSPMNEPLTIIITDEYKDEKFSPSSRDLSDDCSSVQSQDSRRSSLRKSTVTQRNAAPAHLAKARNKDSKLSMSPDGSTCSSLLSPKSSTSRADEKPSPKETMLEAIGLVSRRSLELSPNSDLDRAGAQNKTMRLQPRVSPTAMTVAPKREKRSPAHAGTCGIMRPSILAGGLPKPGSSHLKSIAITYDPVIVEEVMLEPFKPKKPRQKRIWWIEASECVDGNEEKEEVIDERDDEESDEDESVARRTRQRSTSELKSPTLKKGTQAKTTCRADEPSSHVLDESNIPIFDESNSHKTYKPSIYSQEPDIQKPHELSIEKSGKSMTLILGEPTTQKSSEINSESERTDYPNTLSGEYKRTDISNTNIQDVSNTCRTDDSNTQIPDEYNAHRTSLSNTLSDEFNRHISDKSNACKMKGRHNNQGTERNKLNLRSNSKLTEVVPLEKEDDPIQFPHLPKSSTRCRLSLLKDDCKEKPQMECSKEDASLETYISEGASIISKDKQTTAALTNSPEVYSAESSLPSKNLRSTRSKDRRRKDDDDDDNGDGGSELLQQSEDSLMSPLRRSRRPTNKTAKLSEYLTELKKEKETLTKEETKSQKETHILSSCETESTPSDISFKHGRGRPRIYPEKERPKSTEKKVRGRQRKAIPVAGIEQEKLDHIENDKSNLTDIKREEICDELKGKPLLEAESSANCLKILKNSHKLQHGSSSTQDFESNKEGKSINAQLSLQCQNEAKSLTKQDEHVRICNQIIWPQVANCEPAIMTCDSNATQNNFSETENSEKCIVEKSHKGSHECGGITDTHDNVLVVESIDTAPTSNSRVSDNESSNKSEPATELDNCIKDTEVGISTETSRIQSSESSEDLFKKDDDCNSEPPFSLPTSDKSKPPSQKLRIIIRSPNIVAAQTIGELIKKTALSVNPKTLDITVTTKEPCDMQDSDYAAGRLDSSEKVTGTIEEKQMKSYESSHKDDMQELSSIEAIGATEDKDDTPMVSRSGSPDSISAAYDIQSDDFSSETSNDADDFDPCIPNNVDNMVPQVLCNSIPNVMPNSQSANSTIPSFVCKEKSNVICGSAKDEDEDVVIVKAVGLQPPDAGLALKTSQASYTLINNPQHKIAISSVHSHQYSNPLAVMANASNSVAVTSCGRILTTPPVLQQSGTMSHISQQHLSLSPTRQNIHSFMNLHHQTSPQQNQPSVMISEVSPGRFILQQQPNRQDFLTSQDIGQSGLLLQNPGQPGILIQAPNQSGIAIQNATQPGLIFRHTNPTGLMLPPNNSTTILQGQPPILQSTGQGGLSFISLNPSNPLASTIISPIQPLQSHVTPSSILPSNMGLTPLMQAATLGSQSLMIGQPFIAQPGMFLPQLTSQPISSQHNDQIDLARRQQQQQLQSPQPHNPQQLISSVKPSSIIIDPHAHMLSSGLNQTVLKASMQQYSTLKHRPASGLDQKIQLTAPSFSTIQSHTSPSPSLFSLPTTSSILASQTLKTYPSSSSTLPILNLQKTKLSAPKLTKVDGAPAQVNYMGSFDLNTSSLQSVISDSQSFNQDASKRIMELVQSALKNQGKEQIPGVEVTTAITNTPQGPKKVLRVFINEDILPNKSTASTTAPNDVPSLGTSVLSSTSSAMASLLSLGQASSIAASQTGINSEWTKLLPSSSQAPQSQQQSQNLWSPSNTGYVSIPISQNLSTNSRPPSQSPGNSRFLPSAQFRRALKPAVYSHHMKRKHAPSSSSACESSQAKRPVFEKMLKSDGIFSGTLQQIVERHAYISEPPSQKLVGSCISSGLSKPEDCCSTIPSSHTMPSDSSINSAIQEPTTSSFTGGTYTNVPTTVTDDSTANPTQKEPQELPQHPTNHLQHHSYHHIAQEQQQLQRSPHKRASFPLMSPTKKPQVAKALTPSVSGRARKQILQKSVIKKDMLQKCGKEARHQLAEKRKTGVKSRRPNTAVIASHHPLIHHKKGAVSLPQPTLEEEVVATPLDLGKGDHPHYPGTKGDRERSQSRLRFEITSDDGFSCQGDTVEDAWNQVLEKVQDVRAASRMKQLSYAGISGRTMFGLDHDSVVYLIEQLYGAVHCHRNYKFRFHKYDLDQADEEVALNSSGAARSEFFIGRKPFDMFNFLKSVYRTKPGDDEREKEEEMALKSSRRATSLSLPMAMRFRKLKTFAKEAVDVYRSKIHGRGLFCKRNIDAGEMVIEYAGEVIRASLTDKREKYYESKGIGCYMFRIDDDEVVDATMHGSAARFINHSCEPNCFSKVILVDGKKHIVIFAMRPIKRGEELTYDYKFPIEEVKIPCSCGSKRCRKYLN